MSKENEVRQGIQQAKVGELGLGIISLEMLGLSYYAGHATESTGLGLLAFVVLMFNFFAVSKNEEISAWFSLIMGGVVAVAIFAASAMEGEAGLLTSLIMAFLLGGVTAGGNFAGLQHLRDIGAMAPEQEGKE